MLTQESPLWLETQALHAWYDELKKVQLQLDLCQSKFNMSLFINRSTHDTLFLLVYVDDLIIIGSNSFLLDKFVLNLQARFVVKDLMHLHYFLGIQATHTSHGILLSQTKYIQDILHIIYLTHLKP